MAKITTIAAADAPKAVGPYSQARLVSGDAETLYLSGQLPINPATATMPESIEEQTEQSLKNMGAILAEAGLSVDALDALTPATEAGSSKAVNIVLMGRLSKYMDIPEEKWLGAIRKSVKAKFVEMNERAFALGRK